MTLKNFFLTNSVRMVDFANEIQLSDKFFYHIVAGRREFPVSHVTRAEAASGGKLTKQVLRPKDWHLIWPESSIKQKEAKK